MSSEFDLIRRFFTRPADHTDLAVGDDTALFRPQPGMQLAVTTDSLVSGVHFFEDVSAEDLGWKALAVNVSDMAAMGAKPGWATLAITLPRADDVWIKAFSEGFFDCAVHFGVDIIGGDTTRGPLSVTVTALGEVPVGVAILRSGGEAGDDLWISGQPGLAALGLRHLKGHLRLTGPAVALEALHRPRPRVALGIALRGLAHAMLDVSDGLVGDLGHLCDLSGCGAELDAASLPLAALRATGADEASVRQAIFEGGDDYELLFSASPEAKSEIEALAARLGLPLTRIGQLTAYGGTIRLREADGVVSSPGFGGFDHFGKKGD